ncbi:hypothetical protein DN387_06685 [Pseudomonas sp. FBF18]|nr:hypothetical protein [Pseudomonas sp. FBF18]
MESNSYQMHFSLRLIKMSIRGFLMFTKTSVGMCIFQARTSSILSLVLEMRSEISSLKFLRLI